jgi:NADPH:quinone reductase-like Zn-dependent oxidoreductase
VKALLSHETGGPETLTLTDLPEPVPGPKELLVRVRACAINYPDVLIIEDKYQLRPERPFAPGGEIAGEVIGVGEGVGGWATGDRLIAVLGFGGLSEQVVVPAERAISLPKERSFEEGSALLMTYATAIHALIDRGSLQPGQTLLVLGAAGGVGIAAIEVGKALGARVIAAVSLGRPLPGGWFPGRDRAAAAQPDSAQELRRVRRVLGRLSRARPQAQRGACRAAVPLVGRGQNRSEDRRHLSARARR